MVVEIYSLCENATGDFAVISCNKCPFSRVGPCAMDGVGTSQGPSKLHTHTKNSISAHGFQPIVPGIPRRELWTGHTANKNSNCEIDGVPGKLANRFDRLTNPYVSECQRPKSRHGFSTMDGPLVETPHAILRRSPSDQTKSPPHRSISRGLPTRSIFLSSHTHFFSSLSSSHTHSYPYVRFISTLALTNPSHIKNEIHSCCICTPLRRHRRR